MNKSQRLKIHCQYKHYKKISKQTLQILLSTYAYILMSQFNKALN